jgi:hypothetical protein
VKKNLGFSQEWVDCADEKTKIGITNPTQGVSDMSKTVRRGPIWGMDENGNMVNHRAVRMMSDRSKSMRRSAQKRELRREIARGDW